VAWPADTGRYADRVNGIRKYVFSSTLAATEWTNSTLVSDDPVVTVARLKAEGDGHLVMYGWGRPARTLPAHDLVDAVGFLVFPCYSATAPRCSVLPHRQSTCDCARRMPARPEWFPCPTHVPKTRSFRYPSACVGR
jgi:hypothetical protein